MIKYLTKQYDIGEGPLFPKTPLEFCKEKYANKAGYYECYYHNFN